jgi:porin
MLGCLSAVPAAADQDSGKLLLGDWGGARSSLSRRGVDFTLQYDSEFAYNSQGGDSQRGAYADQLVFGTDLDFGRLLGAKGSSLHLLLTDRNGSNLSDKAGLGTLLDVQEVYGRGSITRWTQFYFEQSMLDERLNLAVGRMGVNTDFMAFSCEFMNLGFCSSQPGNIVSTIFNWPVSQWGARLHAQLRPDWYATFGAYQVNPNYLKNSEGLRLDNPGGTTGLLSMAETGWTPKFGPDRLPGWYAIGGWYDSSDHDDVALDVDGQPRLLTGAPPLRRSHASGLYLLAQQKLTRHPSSTSRGLSIFAYLVEADRSTTRIDELAALGLFYVGPLDWRPQDDLGFAMGRSHVNGRLAAAQQAYDTSALPGAGLSGLSPLPVQGSEYPFELFYSLNLTPAATLRPDLQFIHQPGGTAAHRDAVVLGMKLAVSF